MYIISLRANSTRCNEVYSNYEHDKAVRGHEEVKDTLQLWRERNIIYQLLNRLHYDRCFFETAMCLTFPPGAVLLFFLAISVACGTDAGEAIGHSTFLEYSVWEEALDF